jgi:CRISPR type II-A-associated protein Csn2
MKLVYNQYECPIIKYSYFNVLIIENSNEFYNFQYNLQLQMLGERDAFSLSRADVILPMDKNCDWLTSPWNLEINSRKTLNNLYTYLAETLQEEGLDTETIRKWMDIEEIFESAFFDEESVISNKEIIGLNQLFKFFDVKLNDDLSKPLFDRVIDYCSNKARFEKKDLFIFNQFLAYFDKNDIIEFSKYCLNEKIHMLFVEHNHFNFDIQSNCRFTVIDNDLCEIIAHEP